MSRPSGLTLALADVARLAQVSRPVASMWRKRELPGRPFPHPVGTVAGQERFDAFEIADYLTATGRGNNADAQADLAAHAQLAPIPGLDEAAVADGLSALLCLAGMTDEALSSLDQSQLLTLAEDADPDDTYLLREIRALGSDRPALAAHADALADASYSPTTAFELLLRQQLRSTLPGHASVAVRPEAKELVARIAVALAAEAELESPLFVDVTDGSGDLLLATAESYAAEFPPSVATIALDTRSARLARRRMLAHDLHRLDLAVDEGGSAFEALSGDAVFVSQLPPAAQPEMPDVEVLTTIGDLMSQLRDDSRVVILGPATGLTDAPASKEIDVARDGILRSGRLRAAVRLPKGLLVRAPRKALAIYVLGPAHPGVPVAERWTAVADVSQRPLDTTVIGELVTDVASMTKESSARTHAFRFARRVRTAALLAGRKALVDGAPKDRTDAGGTDLAARIDELLRAVDSSSLSNLRVETAETPGQMAGAGSRSLGAAVAAGDCRVVAGNRVDPADLRAYRGPIVVGPEELLGTSRLGSRRVDRLSFAASYPSARFTEPGDVVFCTTPQIGALVDREGGSVVVSPARVLRIVRDPDRGWPPLLADVLAADINAVGTQDGSDAARRSDWRRWPILQVPAGQRERLAETLTALEHERQKLRTRLEKVDALTAAVTQGVTAGALTIVPTRASPAAYDMKPQPDTPPRPTRTNSPTTEGS